MDASRLSFYRTIADTAGTMPGTWMQLQVAVLELCDHVESLTAAGAVVVCVPLVPAPEFHPLYPGGEGYV